MRKANISILALIILSGFIGGFGQNSTARSPTDSRTPTAVAPGSPVGSYPLSGFDTVNLYNGNLNVKLPVYSVGGRGEVGYTITLNIDRRWQVRAWQYATGPGGSSVSEPLYKPEPKLWDGLEPGFSPGVLQGRPSRDKGPPANFAIPPTSSDCFTLSRLTFTSSDGTEYDLRDTQTDGEPNQYTYTFSRGTVFTDRTTSQLTFVSDSAISDISCYDTSWEVMNGFNRIYPSGWLYFSNGTRYRIDNGNVTLMIDRNGNKMTLSNGGGGVITATDSNGKQTNISYSFSQNALGGSVTYKGGGGQSRTATVGTALLGNALRSGYSIKTYRQLFPDLNGASETATFNDQVTSSMTLPDGKQYRFQYNDYGEVARIELPTGGAIEYDWGSGTVASTSGSMGSAGGYNIYRRVLERRVYRDGGTGANWESKTVYSGESPVDVKQYGKDGGNEVFLAWSRHYFYSSPSSEFLSPTFTFYQNYQNGREYKTEILDTNGNVISRSEPTWTSDIPNGVFKNSNPRISQTKTTFADTNQVSQQTFGYDQYLNKIDTYEYDFGTGAPGAFKRRTHTDFVTDTNYTDYTGAHLRSLPLQTWVSSDINGTAKANLTQFEYDNYSGGNNAALVSRVNVFGHDTTNYGTNKTIRGNLTKVTTYGNAQTQTEAISAYSQFDILGNVVKTIDAKGYISTIDYSDRFGSPDGEARSNTAPSQLNGQPTFAFPTSATNALGWITGYSQFDYYTGAAVDAEDINGVVSSSFYDDVLDRPTQSIVANNISNLRRQTTIVYDDVNRKVTTTADLFAFGDNLSRAESYYDALGRTTESRKYEENDNYVAVQTQYDALGRAYKASNPFRPNEIDANNPMRWTTSKFDALGRVIEVEASDGTKAFTAYSGNAVTATDASGRQVRSITDALGQLTRIDEPDMSGNLGTISSPTQPTYYSYDTTGKMVKVQQGSQYRYFLYDSLGRLLRVRQPEQTVNTALNLTDAVTGNSQWTAGFSYDNNGNALTATDAKGVTTTNTYDNLNRALTRSYSDGTPTVTNVYDDPAVPFSKGRLTKVANSISTSQTTAFDVLGRNLTYQQITDGQTYTSSYQYNLSSTLVQETYPSGRVVKNEFESDGKLQRIFGKANATATERTYANAFTYTADGKIKSLKLGNNLWESAKFNSRLQVTELNLGYSATDGSLWKLGYEYGELNADGITVNTAKNTGNIAKQTVSFNGLAQPFVQTYKYDSLYRLTEARETNGATQTWKQTFGYDRFGNRTGFSQIIGSVQLVLDNKTFPQIDATTNRFNSGQGYSYDFIGNVITDADGRQFTFNGDNKQTQVKDVNNNVVGTYLYDGDGKRIKKVTNTETTIFVYSGGKLVAEYSTQPPPTNPTTNYTATDQLGSPRVITNAVGQVTSRRDFMPFGEELFPDAVYRKTSDKYGATDSVRQRFTGYQKDTETGLDFAEARYYNNQHARFTAVDPLLASGKSANPQTFNRYVYVLNNPLVLTDSTGLQAGKKINIVPDPNGNYICRGSNCNRTDPIAIVEIETKINPPFGGTNQLGNPIENPEGYYKYRVEQAVNETARQTGEFIYNVSPDYCKVQCSVPMLGGFELTGSKDFNLFGGGGMSRGIGEFRDFLKQAREFNFVSSKPNIGFRVGCQFACGYFLSGMTIEERNNAISGTSVSATIPIGSPLTLGFNQSLPLSTGARAVEFGVSPTGASFGVGISGSTQLFDFEDYRKQRLNNASFRSQD